MLLNYSGAIENYDVKSWFSSKFILNFDVCLPLWAVKDCDQSKILYFKIQKYCISKYTNPNSIK